MAEIYKETHPQFDQFLPLQTLCYDVSQGENHIKGLEQRYLPPTTGMILDGMAAGDIGYSDYLNYLSRAVFPTDYEDAIKNRCGLLHQKKPVITVPKAMEYMLEDCDGMGTPLHTMLRYINYDQLETGRLGIALDPDPNQLLKRLNIVTYKYSSITNWFGNELVVLDETGSEFIRDKLTWETVDRFRFLELVDVEGLANPVYATRTFTNNVEGELIFPTFNGQKLGEIPFVFVNSTDLLSSISNPPLLGLANMVLTIYKGEADYRRSLHMQGNDTLVISGPIKRENPTAIATTAEPLRVGIGSKIHLVDPAGRAEYIGVNSQGLPEQRLALEKDKDAAQSRAGELVTTQKNGVESNESLLTKISARTVTLIEVALTGAAALKKVLQIAARWHGADPNEVDVVPNTDFTKVVITAKDISDIMDAKIKGAPISNESIHEWLVLNGVTKLSFEDEQNKLDQELNG